jgi:DNA-binding LacI/PurR family transcriptional regulator
LDLEIPVVAFDRTVEDPRADAVIADNPGGAREATEHLLRAGHERVGFVGGLTGIETGAGRLAGYEAAMGDAGLEPRSVNGGFRIEEARAATGRLIDSDGLTAIVVANNLMTIGALRALRDRKARVPDDVALVAIDDPPWAELVEPPLTTLAQPVRKMAASAEELLFERISGRRKEARRVVFDFELRVRGSCGTDQKEASSG